MPHCKPHKWAFIQTQEKKNTSITSTKHNEMIIKLNDKYQIICFSNFMWGKDFHITISDWTEKEVEDLLKGTLQINMNALLSQKSKRYHQLTQHLRSLVIYAFMDEFIISNCNAFHYRYRSKPDIYHFK